MTFPLAIAESVQVTAVLQMLVWQVYCRDSHSLESRLVRAPAQKILVKNLI